MHLLSFTSKAVDRPLISIKQTCSTDISSSVCFVRYCTHIKKVKWQTTYFYASYISGSDSEKG